MDVRRGHRFANIYVDEKSDDDEDDDDHDRVYVDDADRDREGHPPPHESQAIIGWGHHFR